MWDHPNTRSLLDNKPPLFGNDWQRCDDYLCPIPWFYTVFRPLGSGWPGAPVDPSPGARPAIAVGTQPPKNSVGSELVSSGLAVRQ